MVATMKIAGLILIILGVIAVAYGGFEFAYSDKIIDAGPLQVSVTKHRSVPIAPILGVLALAGGLGLLVVGIRASGRVAA